MNYIAVILSLLVVSSSFALAQTSGGSSSGGSAASGAAATGSPGYTGNTLSTGHTISGTAGSSGPNAGNAISQDATGDPAGASSVAQPPPPHDNAVDTPAANNATDRLSNTDTGILKK
jgi:hypothetical protein